MNKIMSYGMGLLACIGTGIGIGLFSGPNWIKDIIIFAILIAILSVVLKSEFHTDYMLECKKTGNSKPSILFYVFLSTIVNGIIILLISLIVISFKKLVGE